jgi:endonuclease YncB( thermonuclease family)
MLLGICLGAAAPGPVDAPPRPPAGREMLPGPVAARVLKVIDGDTLLVRARIWVGQDIEIKVRIAGIDAPELRGRCPAERELARKARDFLRDRVAARPVRLQLIQHGKYAGRVLAHVASDDGIDLGGALLAAGHARRYDGGARRGWCDDAVTPGSRKKRPE